MRQDPGRFALRLFLSGQAVLPLLMAGTPADGIVAQCGAGDRLLLGLSGGKDSLTLLHCLKELQRRCNPARMWTFAAATVDPGTTAFNPRPLIPYLKALGVEYHFLERCGRLQKRAEEHGTGETHGELPCSGGFRSPSCPNRVGEEE